MATATIVFTLFLVTYGADVKHSTYDSLKACQEAKSLATTGMTIEAKKAANEAEAKAEREREIRAANSRMRKYPPREATVAELAEAKNAFGHLYSLSRCGDVDFIVKDGLVLPEASSCSSAGFASSPIEISSAYNNQSIKTAECVIVPEDKP